MGTRIYLNEEQNRVFGIIGGSAKKLEPEGEYRVHNVEKAIRTYCSDSKTDIPSRSSIRSTIVKLVKFGIIKQIERIKADGDKRATITYQYNKSVAENLDIKFGKATRKKETGVDGKNPVMDLISRAKEVLEAKKKEKNELAKKLKRVEEEIVKLEKETIAYTESSSYLRKLKK